MAAYSRSLGPTNRPDVAASSGRPRGWSRPIDRTRRAPRRSPGALVWWMIDRVNARLAAEKEDSRTPPAPTKEHHPDPRAYCGTAQGRKKRGESERDSPFRACGRSRHLSGEGGGSASVWLRCVTRPRKGVTGVAQGRGRFLSRRVATSVTVSPNEPQPLPPGLTDLGCSMVAAGLLGSLAQCSRSTTSLQIFGGPQGSRTPDLRRANRTASSPKTASYCR